MGNLTLIPVIKQLSTWLTGKTATDVCNHLIHKWQVILFCHQVKYCSWHVLSVCLSVCLLAYLKNHTSTCKFHHIFCTLHMAVTHSSC